MEDQLLSPRHDQQGSRPPDQGEYQQSPHLRLQRLDQRQVLWVLLRVWCDEHQVVLVERHRAVCHPLSNVYKNNVIMYFFSKRDTDSQVMNMSEITKSTSPQAACRIYGMDKT